MKSILTPIIALSLLAGGAQVSWSAPQTKTAKAKAASLAFAKSCLTKLAQGNIAVETDIDWQSFIFIAPGTTIDVGLMYRQLPDDKQKSEFRRGFITSYGESFRQQGDVSALRNWRLKRYSALRSVVAATGQRGDIELGVNQRKGQLKLASMTLIARK